MKLYEWEIARTFPPYWAREGLLLAETPEQAKEILSKLNVNRELTRETIREIDLNHAEARIICDEEFS